MTDLPDAYAQALEAIAAAAWRATGIIDDYGDQDLRAATDPLFRALADLDALGLDWDLDDR